MMKIETKDIREVNGMIRIYLDKTVFEITSYSENKLDVLRIRKALYGDVNKDTIERDIKLGIKIMEDNVIEIM